MPPGTPSCTRNRQRPCTNWLLWHRHPPPATLAPACAVPIRLIYYTDTSPTLYRLEVQFNNAWGTVCSDVFKDNAAAATVVCSEFFGAGTVGEFRTLTSSTRPSYGERPRPAAAGAGRGCGTPWDQGLKRGVWGQVESLAAASMGPQPRAPALPAV